MIYIVSENNRGLPITIMLDSAATKLFKFNKEDERSAFRGLLTAEATAASSSSSSPAGTGGAFWIPNDLPSLRP